MISSKKRDSPMHGLIFAASFVAMILAPCFIASGFCKDVDDEG